MCPNAVLKQRDVRSVIGANHCDLFAPYELGAIGFEDCFWLLVECVEASHARCYHGPCFKCTKVGQIGLEPD